MKLGKLAKVVEVAHLLSFYPSGSKLSLFFLTGSGFRDIGPIFKVAIFGHEIWQLAKVREIVHILPKLPPEYQNSLRFALQLAISEILEILHFPIGHKVKFQSFFKKFIFEISKFQEASFGWIVIGNIQKKFG